MSRLTKISAVSFYLPPKDVTVAGNLKRAQDYINEARKDRPDIICLPEFFPLLRVPNYEEAFAESVERQAEILENFQRLAKEARAYLIVDIPEPADEVIYNTAFLLGRDGQIVGKYRKTHLSPGEEQKITAGGEYPVFETDFGKVAIMICMDIHYPEIPRIYALKGVDVLFWPTMAYGPSEDFLITLLRARAMDNQIYCVSSNFSELPYLPGKEMGRACIIAPDGQLRADTGNRPGIATATVNLDEGCEYWVEGELKERYPRLKECFFKTRRPETYGEICKVKPNE